MRILYMSVHAVLEHLEVSLLHELGHEVFSPGAYIDPQKDNDMRPGIPGLVYNQDWIDQYNKISATCPGQDTKEYLTKDFIDNFDMVIIMHAERFLEKNWPIMKHKRVAWRTIGQSIINNERIMEQYRQQGMEIIRYSPREWRIPGFIGSNTMIRFPCNPEEYKDWNGNVERIINFTQSMKQRDFACNYTLFELATRPFPRHLFGPGNEGEDWTTGTISYEQQKKEYRDNRCYFYTGTHPASYTLNFMESMLTGIPMVCIGPKYGNAAYFPGHYLYEIPDIIKNGENGFMSDSIDELQDYIYSLLSDKDLATSISVKGRQTAIDLFGKEKIKEQWKEYLE